MQVHIAKALFIFFTTRQKKVRGYFIGIGITRTLRSSGN